MCTLLLYRTVLCIYYNTIILLLLSAFERNIERKVQNMKFLISARAADYDYRNKIIIYNFYKRHTNNVRQVRCV